MIPCKIANCIESNYCRGLCKIHYRRLLRYGDSLFVVKDDKKRFENSFDKSDNCWNWKKVKNS